MALICTNWKCKRANPDEAAYCYFDGIPLAGASSPGPQRSGTTAFPWPLLLLSGDWCHSFDDLLQVIQRDWTIGVQALQNGLLADFFGHIGRSDLAQAARTAASRDDIDLGMNELLAVLPSQASLPPRLQLTRSEIDLSLEVGQETSFDLRLANEGQRMLCGAVRTDCPWLSLGDGDALRKDFFRFKFLRGWTLPISVRSRQLGVLGALPHPHEGHLKISSNGGDMAAVVRVPNRNQAVPRRGARRGRDSARPRRAHRCAPLAAAAMFENGAVARWYRTNGWAYPVKVPDLSELDDIQQILNQPSVIGSIRARRRLPDWMLSDSSLTPSGFSPQWFPPQILRVGRPGRRSTCAVPLVSR